jgi:HPt (histidine-containing phosphotransfer) domain-containing protein
MLKLPFAFRGKRHFAANNEARLGRGARFGRVLRGTAILFRRSRWPDPGEAAVSPDGVRSYSPSKRNNALRPGPRPARFTRHSGVQSDDTARRTKTNDAHGESVMATYGRAAAASRQFADDALDERHLREMTLGDQSLEREVLQVFARQITLMLRRMVRAEPAHAAAAAHTLKGSARGLGAWRVAEAAERVEQAATGLGDLDDAIAALDIAATEVRNAIETRLQNAAAKSFALYRHATIYPV